MLMEQCIYLSCSVFGLENIFLQAELKVSLIFSYSHMYIEARIVELKLT